MLHQPNKATPLGLEIKSASLEEAPAVTALAPCGRRERCVSAGADRSARLWKLAEETQVRPRARHYGSDVSGVMVAAAQKRCPKCKIMQYDLARLFDESPVAYGGNDVLAVSPDIQPTHLPRHEVGEELNAFVHSTVFKTQSRLQKGVPQ